MQPKPFSQWVLESVLPKDVALTKPVDKKEMERILNEVYKNHPDLYGSVVTDIKKIGDTFSTYEGITMGIDEITPKVKERDAIVKKYTDMYNTTKDPDKKIAILEKAQQELVQHNLTNRDDDATLMVQSGGAKSKAGQLLKLRTTPFVVKDFKGNIVEEIIPKSYAEGVDPLHFWLGAAEARKNLSEGQVSTSAPGELSKVLNNLLSDIVVSMDDCGTQNGIILNTKDEDVIDRYLAKPVGNYQRNTLITPDVQQALLKKGIDKIPVRSPQTCEAPENTVCAKCYGLSIDHGKNHTVGTNVGMRSAQAMSEPLTQMTLSSKHSTTLAKRETGLTGEKGFRTVVEMPKQYPNKKIISELYGVVEKILPAPQGGKYVWIRQTKLVPEKFLVNAKPVPNYPRMFMYYIPPQRKLLVDVKDEVWPAMPITDGNDNIKEIARLMGLGAARTALVQNVRDVFKNTGQDLDRRHFEILSKNMLNYVKVLKAPPSFPFKKGEVVQFNKFQGALNKLQGKQVKVDDAIDEVLMENVYEFSKGTMITKPIVDKLKSYGVKTVTVSTEVDVEPVVAPMTRVLNESDDWVGNLNHRFLKSEIINAAQTAKESDIHGYRPHTAYAYGTEITQDEQGRY